MVSIKNLLAGALLAVAALAQEPTKNFTQTQIDSLLNGSGPNSPTDATRLDWCKSQMTLCGNLCTGPNVMNKCSNTDLSWTCTCTNGSTPGLQYYPISIIGNECNALLGNCLAAGANNSTAQDACQKTYICGNATSSDASNAAKAGSSGSSSTTMSTATGTQTAAATSSAPATHNAAAPQYGQYGPGMGAMVLLGAIAAAL